MAESDVGMVDEDWVEIGAGGFFVMVEVSVVAAGVTVFCI